MPRGSAGGGLSVVCPRTREVEDAGADLSYARDIRGGKPAPGFIGGRVLVVRSTSPGSPWPHRRPRRASQSLSRVTRSAKRTVTDAGGEFRVPIQAPGSYRVTVARSAALLLRALVRRSLRSRPARLRERVGDVARRWPRRRTSAGCEGHARRRADDRGSAWPRRRGVRAVTDRNGGYEVSRLPAGRYTVSIPPAPASAQRRASRARLSSWRRRSGTGDEGDAHRRSTRGPARPQASIAAGVRRDLWALCSTPTGSPAEGARIYLKGAGEGERIVSEPVIADFMGRFVIAARVGVDYILFGERPRPGERSGRVDSTDQLRADGAAQGMKSLRLSLAPPLLIRCPTSLKTRYLERQRHSRAPRSGAGLGPEGAAGRPVSPGDQGVARSDPDVPVRARGLLVLLARRQGLFRRRACSCARRSCRIVRSSRILPSTTRTAS